MIGTDITINKYLELIKNELDRLDSGSVERFSNMIFAAWEEGKFVYICGNGGSAALSSHLAEDLAKGTIYSSDLRDDKKKRLRVLALTDSVPWITAIGNDMAYDQIYVQQLMHFGRPGDMLIAISGSGNSPNVITAVDWANRHGLKTFGMSGFDGGKLKQLQSDGLHVDNKDMGIVESVHGVIIHWLVDDLLARMNKTGRYAQ